MIRRVLKYVVLASLLLALLGHSGDTLRLNPAQLVALPHLYSIFGWQAGNLLSKWTHLVASSLPWRSGPATDGASLVQEYFRLGEEIAALRSEMARTVAQGSGTSPDAAAMPAARLSTLTSAREDLRKDVEEVLESAISAALAKEGVASWGQLTYPPVDMRLDRPPKVMVTSPRDRIVRKFDVLLVPDVSVQESESMERVLYEVWDLSGLVTDIGGLATFPASVNDSASLKGAMSIASHEWVHHYLVGRLTPLGLNSFSSPEMLTLTETFADIVGDEIAEGALAILDAAPEAAAAVAGDDVEQEQPDEGPREFDFGAEMTETRLKVDELLAAGAVDDAEAYMEQRRTMFVANGYHIRKINQAYFAFHGSYGESPQSVSPIAGQLHELRSIVPDLSAFISSVSGASSYREFLDELERLKAESQP